MGPTLRGKGYILSKLAAWKILWEDSAWKLSVLNAHYESVCLKHEYMEHSVFKGADRQQLEITGNGQSWLYNTRSIVGARVLTLWGVHTHRLANQTVGPHAHFLLAAFIS